MNSISDPELRKCKGCKNTLPVTAFATKPNGDYYVLCEVCREKQRAYYQENKEEILEKSHLHYAENREEILEAQKKYAAEHKEHKAEYDRLYREKHEEKIAEYKRQYHLDHREEENARNKKYNEEHKEEVAEYKRRYYQENKVEIEAQKKIYKEEHKEEIAEYFRRYAKEHKEEKATYLRLYRLEHKEKLDEYARNYWSERKEQRAVSYAARRARKRGNGGRYTVADLVSLYELQLGRCCWCGCSMVNRIVYKNVERRVVFTVEHIKALKRGGTSYPHNLVLACISCNSSKGDKDIFTEWQPKNMLDWMIDYVKYGIEIENERNLRDTNETHT